MFAVDQLARLHERDLLDEAARDALGGAANRDRLMRHDSLQARDPGGAGQDRNARRCRRDVATLAIACGRH